MKITHLALTAFLAVAFATTSAAADNKKLLVGRWELLEAAPNGLPKGAIAEFTADGKLKITFKKGDEERTLDGTYTVEGDSITFTQNVEMRKFTEKIIIKKISETELVTVSTEGKDRHAKFKRIK